MESHAKVLRRKGRGEEILSFPPLRFCASAPLRELWNDLTSERRGEAILSKYSPISLINEFRAFSHSARDFKLLTVVSFGDADDRVGLALEQLVNVRHLLQQFGVFFVEVFSVSDAQGDVPEPFDELAVRRGDGDGGVPFVHLLGDRVGRDADRQMACVIDKICDAKNVS